jgi:hypothetical protein
MSNPEQLAPEHIAALETVRALHARAERGELLRDAILHATSLAQYFEPSSHWAVISELADSATRLHTWTEYKPGHEYNSSAGVECDVLAAGFSLPGIVNQRESSLRLHFKRMQALYHYETSLPAHERRLGAEFYGVVCDIKTQRRAHARKIMQLTTTDGPLGSFHSFFRREASLVLSSMQDITVNPKYL